MKDEKPKQNKYSRSASPRQDSSSARPAAGKAPRSREKGAEKTSQRPIQQSNSYLDEVKNDLMAFFQINDEQTFTQEQVLDHFDVGDRKMKLIMHGLIGELSDEGSLIRNADGSYRANKSANTLEGVVDHVNSRFAFVIPSTESGIRGDRDDDIWVATEDLNGAVDGDRVK